MAVASYVFRYIDQGTSGGPNLVHGVMQGHVSVATER